MNKEVGNVQLVKKINRAKILDFFRKNPNSSKLQAKDFTGLSPASLTNITGELIQDKLLIESGIEEVERVGRKSLLFSFNNDYRDLICIHFSTKHLKILRTNLSGTLRSEKSVRLSELTPESGLRYINETVSELISTYGEENFLGIGVFLSGIVVNNEKLLFSSGLKWKNCNFAEHIGLVTNLPVIVENTTTLNAQIYFNSSNHLNDENVVFFDMECGIGMRQYIDGNIRNNILGEIGHTVIDLNGVPCFCGSRGCLDAMCSINNALHLYSSYTGKTVSEETFSELLISKDKDALKVADISADYLAIGLFNCIKLFNPTSIVCNIQYYAEHPYIPDKALGTLKNNINNFFGVSVPIKCIRLDKTELLSGMASYMCDKFFS